jgi:hypothetical protein
VRIGAGGDVGCGKGVGDGGDVVALMTSFFVTGGQKDIPSISAVCVPLEVDDTSAFTTGQLWFGSSIVSLNLFNSSSCLTKVLTI